jgi:phage FluMu protein Com
MKQKQLEKFFARPFSWSNFSSFRDYDKEEWYNNYILGKKAPPNARMTFGSLVGKRIETDPTYIPQLPREGTLEYEVKVMMGDIELVGYMDAYCPDKKIINEFKTSSKAGWSQKKVDVHDQLTFYALLLYLKYKTKPEDLTIRLHHLHTCETGDFNIAFCKPFTIDTYITKRTTKQVLMFASEIIRLRKEMEEYILTHE